jgi:signal transduction histidine kinase
MWTGQIPPKLVSPKVVAIVIFVLTILTLGAEIMDYWATEAAISEQVERSLSREAKRLFAVLEITKELNFLPAARFEALNRYLKLSEANSYVEVMEGDLVLYRSANLDPSVSLATRTPDSNSGKPVTIAFSSQSMRVFALVENPYRIYVARALSIEEVSWTRRHSFMVLVSVAFLLLLAPASAIVALYWHRPARALRRHVEGLWKQPRHLPLPPVPDFAHHDTNELVERIHTVIKDIHDSRSQSLTFSSMASHEMRTPLSIVRHQLETALASPTNEAALQKLIASAYDEVLRLSGTVEDLLNLSTLQAGAANLNFSYISVHEFLKTLYDEALFLTRPKDITAVLSKGPSVTIEADESRLRQVFLNLLDNSIKNTPRRGRIRISYEERGNCVVITFSDTGRGISPENLSRIFEPFFRVSSQDTDMHGSGLGLSLVKWIIESHRGKVSVESELGKGTTFYIQIPRYQSTPA